MLLGVYLIIKSMAELVYGRIGIWPNCLESPITDGIMKDKSANRLMSIIDEIWVIHLQKVDTLLMIGI